MDVRNANLIDPSRVISQGADRAMELVDSMPVEYYAVGCAWYTNVSRQINELAARSGYSAPQIAGVLANYNRNQSWSGSKTLTMRAVMNNDVVGLTSVVSAVRAILALPRTANHDAVVPYLTNGSKTKNFYWACLDLAGCPCDRHIYAVWGLPQREAYYPLVVEGVQSVAYTLQVTDRQAEACIWLARVWSMGRDMRAYLP